MSNTVSTRVYQFNPNSFWVISIYFVLFLIFFSHLMSMSQLEIMLSGGFLLAVPLYVRYGNNKNVKLRTWDKRPLVFSSEGIQFGPDHYPVQSLETTAIYLESFTGFEYRELGPTADPNNMHVYVKADGDKNKISFRFQEEVQEFTFCLSSYAEFCMFRAVIHDWTEAGVNVALRQVFEDEFIIREMEYYNIPGGFV